jgi:hypothetical protein
VLRCRATLLGCGVEAAALERAEADAREEAARAVAAARAMAWPALELAWADVQDVGAPR